MPCYFGNIKDMLINDRASTIHTASAFPESGKEGCQVSTYASVPKKKGPSD
jgi:hypothetical protein